MTVAELDAFLRTELFPEGLAENLVVPFASSIKACLIEMQRYIPCQQQDHISVYPQCSTYYRCGATVIDVPNGRITKVYTIPTYPTEEWCKPIVYRQVEWNAFNSWYRLLADLATAPDQGSKPLLPMGFQYPDSSSDSDYGRALAGIWCINKGKLWVGPWLQSVESLVVEWDGLNVTWAATDVIPEGEDIKRCVGLYIRKDHPEWFEDGPVMAAQWRIDYATQFADISYECSKRTMVNPDNTNQNDMESILLQKWQEQPLTHQVASPIAEASVAFISDYGTGDSDELAVSELVKAAQPDAIATTGDNYQPDHFLGATPDYDLSVSPYFSDYIFPYNGAPIYGSGATENAFWPAIGNHDYDTSVTPQSLNSYLDYFKLPNNGRYYDVVVGSIHLFILNSVANEPDGVTATSTQAKWLQTRLALSTIPWKIVLCHYPPYSSGVLHGGTAGMRWPFKEWGASMVISGHDHDYERIVVNEFTYIVNGIAGGALRDFGATVTGSQVRYNSKYGAFFITANCDQLTATATSVDGDTIDSFTMNA